MIVVDTHIWIWWVNDRDLLSRTQRSELEKAENSVICVSAISCWEIAKLTELGRTELGRPVESWLELALSYASMQLVDLTPEIAVASTQLPGNFHRDPADQIIVATARLLEYPLVTSDRKILNYPHVDTVA